MTLQEGAVLDFLRNMLDEYVAEGRIGVRRHEPSKPFRRRALFRSDDALRVRSTALVLDEFLVNADVLVAYFARNMLDEYVDEGRIGVRRHEPSRSLHGRLL